MKLAFIDDEELLCLLFPKLFNLPGVEIKTYSDPFTAIRECRLNPPDMIFTDHCLGGSINGETLATTLNLDIPVYLLSGGEHFLDDFKYPFKGILAKPLDFEKITQILEEFKDIYSQKVA